MESYPTWTTRHGQELFELWIVWQVVKLLTSHLLLRRVSKDPTWNHITRKTNELGLKAKRNRKEVSVIPPKVLAPTYEKGGEPSAEADRIFKNSWVSWHRVEKERGKGNARGICYCSRDEGGREECSCHQWGSKIHSRSGDLSIKQGKFGWRRARGKDVFPIPAFKLQLKGQEL